MRRRGLNPRFGFTLIELLVVLGIISVLMAILLPVLAKARHSARTARCLATLRQLELAWQLYTQEHKGCSIPFYIELELWMGQLRGVYSKIDSSRLCPEAAESSPPSNDPVAIGVGGVFCAWGPKLDYSFINTQTGSYAFNGWLYYYNTDGERAYHDDLAHGMSDTQARTFWKNDFFNGPVARSSEVPCFMDGTWVDAWPDSWQDPPPTLYISNAQVVKGNMMGRVCLARHGRAINISFCDGHCATVPLEQLWALYWRPGYVRPAQLPKLPDR